MKNILKTIFQALIISLFLVVFVDAARTQYGYPGVYNSSVFTLSSGDGSAVSVDVNGNVKVSTSSVLSEFDIVDLDITGNVLQMGNASTTFVMYVGSTDGCMALTFSTSSTFPTAEATSTNNCN